MKIITKIALVISSLIVLCSCNKNAGTLISSTEFKGQEINNIVVDYAFTARIIKTGNINDNRIELRIGEKLIPKLETSLVNGKLSVSLENIKVANWDLRDKLFVDIYTTEFSSIDASDATDFTIEDDFTFNSLQLSASGASKIDFMTSIDIRESLKIDISGASDISMEGTEVGSFTNANISGASALDIYELEVASFRYEISGASALNIRAGKCPSTDAYVSCSGASKYDTPNFVVDAMTIILSGASYANINVLGEIKTDITGASNLEYKKNPNTVIKKL